MNIIKIIININIIITIVISKCPQMLLLRKLMQGDEQNLKAPLSDNFRRIQMLNNRPIRTNINFSNSVSNYNLLQVN